MAITAKTKTRAKTRATWRPYYSATTWQALWAQMHATMADRTGRNATYPPLSNAEAVQFVRVWRGATTSDGTLWYQLAAAAYGWDPPRATMRVDAKQAAATYPLARELWDWSKGIAVELDARALPMPDASLAPNKATFGDPTFYGEVRAHLLGDGADPAVITGQRALAPSAPPQKGSAWLLWVAVAWMMLSPKSRRRRQERG